MNKLSLSVIGNCVTASVVGLAIIMMSFIVLEPTISRAITDDFTVTQTIGAEISFVASTSDVVMDTTISPITGGTSNGTTTVGVRTNNFAGYNMTIHFSSTTAMARNGGSGVIENYAPAAVGVPDYTFVNELFGQLAYRVTGAQAVDVDLTFRDNGTDTCSVGAVNTPGTCWFNPEPVGGAEMIINRTTSTPVNGASTTINFRVHVPPNPVPTVPSGVYTATATLTAIVN